MNGYQNGFVMLPILIGIVVLAIFGGIGYAVLHNRPATINNSIVPNNSGTASSSPVSSGNTNTPVEKTSLFGTMIAFNVNDALMGMSSALQKGWSTFRTDGASHQNLLGNLQGIIKDRIPLVKETDFSIDRGSFGYFTWNVIEPQKGQFDWGLTDLYAQAASNTGVKISAVIQPFASWDQKNTQVNANCKMLDAAYYDYKAGPPNDVSEYENFLTKTVARYKGTVAVWEIGNEPDAECNGYQNNPRGYVDLLKISSETIKKADPNAQVTNGGASGHSDNSSERDFWTTFFQLGGGTYIDYFNFHYNTERSPSATLDPAALQKELTFFNDLMYKNGDRKSLYLTEFGIYSGTPSSQMSDQPAGAPRQVQILAPFQPTTSQQPFNPSPQPPQSGASVPNRNLPNESEAAQAALYFRDSILAFAGGVHTIFIDLVGPNDSVVGSSMAFNTDNHPRLFLTTLKTIANKIKSFSKVEKIADGQYAFTVNSKTVYAFWSGTLPSEILGKVKVTDIKGQERTMDATAVKISADQPTFIESSATN